MSKKARNSKTVRYNLVFFSQFTCLTLYTLITCHCSFHLVYLSVTALSPLLLLLSLCLPIWSFHCLSTCLLFSPSVYLFALFTFSTWSVTALFTLSLLISICLPAVNALVTLSTFQLFSLSVCHCIFCSLPVCHCSCHTVSLSVLLLLLSLPDYCYFKILFLFLLFKKKSKKQFICEYINENLS